MATERVTHPDGTFSEVETNDAVQFHGVDAAGVYLGLVDSAFAHVPEPPPGGTYAWDFALQTWNRTFTIEERREIKWGQIKARRSEVEFGSFVWDGSTFDSDPTSTGRIMGAFALALAAKGAGAPYQQEWTLADNTKRSLNADEMIGVGVALGTSVGTAHGVASYFRDQIESATTQAELDAITWPA